MNGDQGKVTEMTARPQVNESGPGAGEKGGWGSLFRGRRSVFVVAPLALAVVVALYMAVNGKRKTDAVVAHSAPFAAALEGQGRLEAHEVVEVGAESSGRIAEVWAEEGEEVEAGELLARFDQGEAKAQLRSAEASAAAARNAVSAARAELQGAEVQWTQLRDDYARLVPLSGAAVPRSEVEGARAAAEGGEAEVGRARARLDQAEAQAQAAEADVASMRRRLEKLDVRSPAAGVVVTRWASPGDVVGMGVPLFRVADPATLRVWVPFDESVLGELGSGMPARVSFFSDPARSYPGRVALVGREVDSETREVQVQVALSEAPEGWALGQRATVLLDTKPGGASLAVPGELLAWREGEPGLYTAKGGRAIWVPVTLGRARAEQVEITGGLAQGDTILVPEGLRDRTRVQPTVSSARGES
jgi:HlyD family secretion protein